MHDQKSSDTQQCLELHCQPWASASLQVGRRRGEVEKEVNEALRYVVSPFTKEEAARRRRVSPNCTSLNYELTAACTVIIEHSFTAQYQRA
jgi:hypothetical protein